MRISATPGDPGYQTFMMLNANHKKPHVIVNALEVDEVILVDDEKGIVRRYKTTPDGKLVVDKSGEFFETETLTGNFEVVLDDAK